MALANQADVEAVLQFTFTNQPDSTITLYLGWADSYMKRWLRRPIEAFDEASAIYQPIGTVVAAPDYPVNELTVVEDGTTLTVGDDYVVEPGGIIRRVTTTGRYRTWDLRPGKVVLSGNYGYTTVPTDLTLATARFVADLYREGSRSDGSGGEIKSETVGDHQVVFDTSSLAVQAGESFRRSGALELAQAYRRTIDNASSVLPLTSPPAYTP